MPGQAIGTTLLYGYPGAYARNGDCNIRNRIVKGTDTTGPSFGDPVVLNTDNTYSKFGATGTAAKFAGVAVKEVKQDTAYSTAFGNYSPGQPCDVINRGSVMVKCNVGTPTAGGAVYIRVAVNESIPAGIISGFEAAADSTNTIAITNCKWNTGNKDANGVCELTILTKVNP